MKIKVPILTIIVAIVFFTNCKRLDKSNDKRFFPITSQWLFKNVDSSEWYVAQVPGCVHTDLYKNKLIPDPYFGCNEKQIQWIGKANWEYKTSLIITPELLQYNKIELIFEGIDTHSEIYINQQKCAETNNMFRSWIIDCKPFLKEGENELHVKFISPYKENFTQWQNLNYILPAFEDNTQYIRKAAYHWSWDWAPKMVTMGIWRPVYLQCYNIAKITDVYLQQNALTEHEAKYTASIELEAVSNETVTITLKNLTDNLTLAENNYTVNKGTNQFIVNFSIVKPKLWWTNGIGEQSLYSIATLVSSKNKLLDSDTLSLGIRKIELIQQKDSVGYSFYFNINGKRVFMKGANYIPQDCFLANVTPDRYQKIIETAKQCNMNMLRVWGGGIYENELFYKLCDKNGILVWQDFMFSLTMVPNDSSYINNVKKEAIENIKRLRNHACLALWCGNNENDICWKKWGFKSMVDKKFHNEIWEHYKQLFQNILPALVKEYNAEVAYISSSPIAYNDSCSGFEQHSGDIHYWDVWNDKKSIDYYNHNIGRFMSEYGFQGMPEMATINSFALPEDKKLGTDVMKCHQRRSIGYELMDVALQRDYINPKSFENYVYVSQLLQAQATKTAIEAHRRNMPYCMGTLYWQLNDCWPVVSWATIDYFNRWKAAQYVVKKSFNDIIISFENSNETLKVYAISDRMNTVNATLSLVLSDFNGNKLFTMDTTINILPNTSKVVVRKNISELVTKKSKNTLLVYAKLISKNQLITDNIYYFVSPKELKLSNPKINCNIEKISSGYKLTFRANTLVKNLYIITKNNIDGALSDNFFDLIPNEDKIIIFKTTNNSLDNYKQNLQYYSLIDSY